MDKYAVLEQGNITMYGTYEECCEYLDNIYPGWEKGMRVLDVGIIQFDGEEDK